MKIFEQMPHVILFLQLQELEMPIIFLADILLASNLPLDISTEATIKQLTGYLCLVDGYVFSGCGGGQETWQ